MEKVKEEKGLQQLQVQLNPEISKWRGEIKIDKGLQESLERRQVQDIVARRLPTGAIEIICGHRRYAHLLALGRKPEEMNMKILENVGDEDAILMAFEENVGRQDLSPVQEARAFQTMAGKPFKWHLKDIAKKVGRSENYVRDRLALLELPAAVQGSIESGKVEISYAPTLQKLKEFPDAQKALAKRISEHDYSMRTVKDAEENVEQVLQRKKEKEELLTKYGPCPKCGSKDIEEEFPRGKLVCKEKGCGYAWNGETKDPWEYYMLKQNASDLGLKIDFEGPDNVKLSPKEMEELVNKQTSHPSEEDAEVNPAFRCPQSLEAILRPLLTDDSIQTLDVDGDEISLKLIQGTRFNFKGIRKSYKTGEKCRIIVSKYWGFDNGESSLANKVKAVKEYVLTLKPEDAVKAESSVSD